MTSPAVIPMSSGDRPTESGWYVMLSGTQRIIVDVDVNWIPPRYYCVGVEGHHDIRGQIFVARIYPDRIGEEG